MLESIKEIMISEKHIPVSLFIGRTFPYQTFVPHVERTKNMVHGTHARVEGMRLFRLTQLMLSATNTGTKK